VSLRSRVTRLLPDDAGDAVSEHVVLLTIARFSVNSVYRYGPPFLATIAAGLGVSLARAGVALSVAELFGLTSPLIGRAVDRMARRASMSLGLAGVTAGAVVAASATGLPLLAVGLAVLSVSKTVFDVGLASWIADEVPYRSRGRVGGITETSWALGLLLGVTGLGLLTAVTGWRWAFGAGAAFVAVMAAVVRRGLPGGPGVERKASTTPVLPTADPTSPGSQSRGRTRVPASAWLMVGAMGSLMAASQCVFVSFGAWLEDRFGFGSAGIAAVGFGLGAIELTASVTSAGRADHWGKHRSAVAGCLLMAPTGALMWLADDHLATGLPLLGLYLLGFEFAIVSAIPAAANLVPGAPGAGLGAAIGGGAIGRAIVAIAATVAYERFGFGAPALLGAALAITAASLFAAHGRLHAQPR
jgi:DHA1 family inner membrane transport protein